MPMSLAAVVRLVGVVAPMVVKITATLTVVPIPAVIATGAHPMVVPVVEEAVVGEVPVGEVPVAADAVVAGIKII